MKALVLGGGASKGSWQAGAIWSLIDHGHTWDYIVGVSVGALNGAMIAVGKSPEKIWWHLETDSVYKKFNKIKVAWRILRGQDSVYSTDPLRSLLQKNLLGATVNTELIFVTTDVTSGDLVTVTWPVGMIIGESDLEYLRASASMPILFDPIIDGEAKLVDGGVRQINPLGTALAYDPDHLTVVLCGPTGMLKSEVSGVLSMAGRTVDIFLNEIFNSDLDTFLTINDIVEQANAQGIQLMNSKRTRPLKSFKCDLFYPAEDLGDGMDFSSQLMRERYTQGVSDTILALQENG